MMKNKWSEYTDYSVEQAVKLLSIDSPSGYGREVTDYLLKELEELGIKAHRTVKGGVVADFGGLEGAAAAEIDGQKHGEPGAEGGILLEAHCDTLAVWWRRLREPDVLRLRP